MSYPTFQSLSVLLGWMGILIAPLSFYCGNNCSNLHKSPRHSAWPEAQTHDLPLVSFSSPFTSPTSHFASIHYHPHSWGVKSKPMSPRASPRSWNVLAGTLGSFVFWLLDLFFLGSMGKLPELDYLFSSFMLPKLSQPCLNHVIGKSHWKGNLILPCVASLHILFRSVMDLSASLDEVQSQW